MAARQEEECYSKHQSSHISLLCKGIPQSRREILTALYIGIPPCWGTPILYRITRQLAHCNGVLSHPCAQWPRSSCFRRPIATGIHTVGTYPFSSSHGCELRHRVVYLAMRYFSLIITRCGGICSLGFVCFEYSHLRFPFRILDVLLTSFDCQVICIYDYSGWPNILECPP